VLLEDGAREEVCERVGLGGRRAVIVVRRLVSRSIRTTQSYSEKARVFILDPVGCLESCT
jgi:hypothetical protein